MNRAHEFGAVYRTYRDHFFIPETVFRAKGSLSEPSETMPHGGEALSVRYVCHGNEIVFVRGTRNWFSSPLLTLIFSM